MSGATRPRRSRLQSVGAYFFVAGLSQLGNFLTRYAIAAIVVTGTFGRFDAVLSLGSLLAIVLALGLQASVGHYVAFHHDEPSEQRRYASSALAAQQVVTAGFIAVLLLTVAWLSGGRELIGFDRGEWLAAAFVALATTSSLLPSAALLSRRNRAPLLWSNLIRLASLALLVVTLAAATSVRSVTAIAVGWSIGAIVQAVPAFAATRDLFTARSIDRDAAVETVRYGAGAFLHAASGWVLIACDRVILNAKVSPEQLGRYSLAYLLAFSYEQIFQIANQLALPVQYRLLKDPSRSDDLLGALRAASFVVLATSAVFVGVFPYALELVVPSRFGNLEPLIAVLGAAVYWSGIYFTVVNVLFFHRRVRPLAVTTALSALVGVVPIFFLVDRLGVMAAAWATLAGYFVHYLLVAIVGRRLLPQLPVWVHVVGGAGVVGLAVSHTTAITGRNAALLAVAASALVAIVLFHEARTIPWSRVRALRVPATSADDTEVPDPDWPEG